MTRLIPCYLCAVALVGTQNNARAADLEEVAGFGSDPGNLTMFRFVPDDLPDDAALVVALHGCTQQAADYDDESGWTKYAERGEFALVLPQQNAVNNPSRCFNWFESGDIERGGGEALSIKQMVDKMFADHTIGANKVFITGLSAGAYMATVMLATYPDIFAGGAIVAGGPYRCGIGLVNAFACMNPGTQNSPSTWGDLVRSSNEHAGPWPIVSLWHGDADPTVNIKNMAENVAQWTNVHGADLTADVSDTVQGFPHQVYELDGLPVVETYTVTGMGHGTPIDQGSATNQCGTPGAFLLDVGICSAYYIGKFWGIVADDDGDDREPVPNDNGLYCGTDTNANHASSGRANAILGMFYYAEGSWNWMGIGADTLTTLQEAETGEFHVVSSCPPSATVPSRSSGV